MSVFLIGFCCIAPVENVIHRFIHPCIPDWLLLIEIQPESLQNRFFLLETLLLPIFIITAILFINQVLDGKRPAAVLYACAAGKSSAGSPSDYYTPDRISVEIQVIFHSALRTLGWLISIIDISQSNSRQDRLREPPTVSWAINSRRRQLSAYRVEEAVRFPEQGFNPALSSSVKKKRVQDDGSISWSSITAQSTPMDSRIFI